MSPLIDRYGRVHDYLRISVTQRCNLRCVYCMPAEGLPITANDQYLTLAEIERLVRVMAGLGVRKVRLTGGEPTVRPDIVEIVRRVSAVDGINTVAMTTNGILYSEKAKALQLAGLNTVNISLDSLNRETFAKITRRDQFEKVMRSIETALSLGYDPLKVNTVVMPGINEAELLDFVEWTRHVPINVRFIEYMPFKGNQWDPAGYVSFAEMKRRIEAHYELHMLPETVTVNRIAEDYKVAGFRGSVSFIASMSQSFCATCSRLRLTANGDLKACLFFPAQINVRDLLRRSAADGEIESVIRDTVLAKPKGHPDPAELAGLSDLSMIEIGG